MQELIVVLFLTVAKCSEISQKDDVVMQTYRHSTSSSSLSRVSKAE